MLRTAFLFCSSYTDSAQPDADYAEEYRAVTARGGRALLFDFDRFLAGGSLKMEAASAPVTLIYRGWMLPPDQYARLYTSLQAKGYTLINSPEQYRACHELPSWYGQVRPDTAESVWSEGIPDDRTIRTLLARMGNRPLIVKDYVKSRKHEWLEACYIPDASDTEQALRVIRTFIERQDTELAGGIVLREYLPLALTGAHPKSGMPTAREVRVFCFRHTPFAAIGYWTGEGGDLPDGCRDLAERYRNLDSNFHTVDLAQLTDGSWTVMEAGDGQVSGLQDFDAGQFYDRLSALMKK